MENPKRKILFTAFKGKNNSSKVILDLINNKDKLYLTNSFKTSAIELTNELNNNYYDFIIMLGQSPLEFNNIRIETTAILKDTLTTSYKYQKLKILFELNKFNVKISNNAGHYLCNNIYYNALNYIKINKLNTKVIFIHIPQLNNIENKELLSNIFMKNIFDI